MESLHFDMLWYYEIFKAVRELVDKKGKLQEFLTSLGS